MKQSPAIRAWLYLPVIFLGLLAAGCASDTWETITSPEDWHVFAPPEPPPPPAESLVLRGEKLEAEKVPTNEKEAKAAAQLAGAHDLYRNGKYDDAQRIFHKVADNKKIAPFMAEEARYYEAESLRQQRAYPKAADTYNRLLNDFPSGIYREQAIQHMFEIANLWQSRTCAGTPARDRCRRGNR